MATKSKRQAVLWSPIREDSVNGYWAIIGMRKVEVIRHEFDYWWWFAKDAEGKTVYLPAKEVRNMDTMKEAMKAAIAWANANQ